MKLLPSFSLVVLLSRRARSLLVPTHPERYHRLQEVAPNVGVDAGLLIRLMEPFMEEGPKSQDGAVTSSKRVAFTTETSYHEEFAKASNLLHQRGKALSHVTSYGSNEQEIGTLNVRVSRLTFTCLCATLDCREAAAADLAGVHDPNFGLHRQSSPIIMYSKDGSPLPCLTLVPKISVDPSKVSGCSLFRGEIGKNRSLLVESCENDSISSFSITSDEVSGRTLTPGMWQVKNVVAGPEYAPDPGAFVGDVLGGSTFVESAVDSLLGILWPTDFNENRAASDAGMDELYHVLYRYAYYGYTQTEQTEFEHLSNRQLESVGLYVSLLAGRPEPVTWTEVVTNAIVMIASAVSFGWLLGRIFQTPRTKNTGGISAEFLEVLSSLVASALALIGTLVVFVVQWQQMNEYLGFRESIMVSDVAAYSRTGSIFFGRVHRDFDLVEMSITTVDIQDISQDSTWLFALLIMVAATGLGFTVYLAWTGPDVCFQRLVNRCRLHLCLVIVVVALIVAVTVVIWSMKTNTVQGSFSPAENVDSVTAAQQLDAPYPDSANLVAPVPSIPPIPVPAVEDPSAPVKPPIEDGGASGTIWDIIRNSPDHKVLREVIETTDTMGAFSGQQASLLTLFAPTDNAFPPYFDLLGIDGILGENTNDLIKGLAYHILEGVLTNDEESTYWGLVETRLEDSLWCGSGKCAVCISWDNGVFSVNGIRPDPGVLEATNGVVHVIDQVLVPQRVAQYFGAPSFTCNIASPTAPGTEEPAAVPSPVQPTDPPMPTTPPQCVAQLPLPNLPPFTRGALTCINCCQGSNACSDNRGFIADNSCNGYSACTDNEGYIAEGSCNGYQACDGNKLHILERSCNNYSACTDNSGRIGPDSCSAYGACDLNTGVILGGSCNDPCTGNDNSCNGYSACDDNEGCIAEGSCNGYEACDGNKLHILERSCNEHSACTDNSGQIGPDSCSGYGACDNNDRTIGPSICNEQNACDN